MSCASECLSRFDVSQPCRFCQPCFRVAATDTHADAIQIAATQVELRPAVAPRRSDPQPADTLDSVRSDAPAVQIHRSKVILRPQIARRSRSAAKREGSSCVLLHTPAVIVTQRQVKRGDHVSMTRRLRVPANCGPAVSPHTTTLVQAEPHKILSMWDT